MFDFKDYSQLVSSEKQHMESVYDALELRVKEKEKKVNAKRKAIESDSFDDHHYQIPHGEHLNAITEYQNEKDFVESIYDKPYFAHIEILFSSETTDSVKHIDYYLSDNEYFDSQIEIGKNRNQYLIPFKKDPNRSISIAIFKCYTAKDGNSIDYYSPSQVKCTVKPTFICDDKILKRNLMSVMLLFPSFAGKIDADEMLAELLDENRDDPILKNIISTLQQQQFAIIEADTNQSFIVQGCAGSGKSQCIFHRLFFLREELSDRGWNRVLLITPNQLFRSYSADLIRRFRLNSVKSFSISDFYCQLLNVYDTRFKNRQYKIQLSEEYLPDKYLREIYSDTTISKIEKEITNAIYKIVKSACAVLGLNAPKILDVSTIVSLKESLHSAIDSQTLTEEILKDDEDYQALKNERDNLIKCAKTIDRERNKTNVKIKKLSAELEELRALIKENNPEKIKLHVKKSDPETLLNKKQKELDEYVSKKEELISEHNLIKKNRRKCIKNLRKIIEGVEGKKMNRTIDETELKRVASISSRIESFVFEQTVWNTISSIKKKYNVNTIIIEFDNDSHRHETKILYKADLFFYLKIYTMLYPDMKLPDYQFFCIDEAQDLHKADYTMLRNMFPNAVFNLFGDIEQVLHSNCGINEWKEETGISTIYYLNKNYRNTAATVDFCNRRFESNMQSIGKVKTKQKPLVLNSKAQLNTVIKEQNITVIVKDIECFKSFKRLLDNDNDCEYIDTNSIDANRNLISCYSVFAAKGLEFSNVLVFSTKMTNSQKLVACTRAMKKLYYYESNE